MGTGQTCISANRMYVQSGVYDSFARKLVDKVKQFRVGDGFSEQSTLGPMIHSRALEKVVAHVADAQKKGAKVLYGGKPISGKGTFHEPTVLVDLNEDCDIASEETFGVRATSLGPV